MCKKLSENKTKFVILSASQCNNNHMRHYNDKIAHDNENVSKELLYKIQNLKW